MPRTTASDGWEILRRIGPVIMESVPRSWKVSLHFIYELIIYIRTLFKNDLEFLCTLCARFWDFRREDAFSAKQISLWRFPQSVHSHFRDQTKCHFVWGRGGKVKISRPRAENAPPLPWRLWMDAQERPLRLLWTSWALSALESSNSNDERMIEAPRSRKKKVAAWKKILSHLSENTGRRR